MTTIAANLECMAADSAVTGNHPRYHADKIFRVGLSLLGTAGDGDMCLAFVEWFRGKRNPMVLQKMIPLDNRYDIVILELRQGALYKWSAWGYPEKLHEKFYAIGSGSMTAIEALSRGATPHDAVKSAMKWDEYTDSPIQVEHLKPAKRRR